MTVIDTYLDRDVVDELRAAVRGPVFAPGDNGYEEVRTIYNVIHDQRPGAIVRAASVADVIASVSAAREHELLLAVRGGSHGIAAFATCEGGLMLDLGAMRGLRVDPPKLPPPPRSGRRPG